MEKNLKRKITDKDYGSTIKAVISNPAFKHVSSIEKENGRNAYCQCIKLPLQGLSISFQRKAHKLLSS